MCWALCADDNEVLAQWGEERRRREDGPELGFKEPQHFVAGWAELSQPRKQRRNSQRGGKKAGVCGLSFPHGLRHSDGARAEAKL